MSNKQLVFQTKYKGILNGQKYIFSGKDKIGKVVRNIEDLFAITSPLYTILKYSLLPL